MIDEQTLKEKIGGRVRQLRNLKRWSRQQVAEKLEMSVNGYSNIERGEVDVPLTRLCQIAEIFNVEVSEILDTDKKNIFNFHKSKNAECFIIGINSTELKIIKDTQLKYELEKAVLLLQEREKEINYLKEENTNLKQILEWIKTK